MTDIIMAILNFHNLCYNHFEMRVGGKRVRFFIISFFILIDLTTGCYLQRLDREIKDVSEKKILNKNSPFLKVHMMDGSIYILSKWNVNEKDKFVEGEGELLDVNRNIIERDFFRVPIQDVALFETNVTRPSLSIAAMTIVTGLSLGMTAYCAANPKACFGSCPTFYVWDGKRMSLQAEGFSASIAPALESTDIDALYQAKPDSQFFNLIMKNEALETHVIRFANILAAPRPYKGRTFVTPSGVFYQVIKTKPPSQCIATEGNCLEKVLNLDGRERFSPADSENLAKKESIELSFDTIPEGEPGLVLGFRQTLLTTFLFYQTLAFMGNSAALFFAKLERDAGIGGEFIQNLSQVLGGIEIYIQGNNNKWIKVGEIDEAGPIATNLQIVPFPNKFPAPLRVKLLMTRALWRLDYIALVQITEHVEPFRIYPHKVIRGDIVDENAKEKLIKEQEYLVTMPGDEYKLEYLLPEDFENYELFIETRGYYLEWIRDEWIKEENLDKFYTLIFDPHDFFKTLAPEFKKVESKMEQSFWNSKYVRR